MKKNRTLWIVLGITGGLLGLCCFVAVLGILAWNISGEPLSAITIDLGVPTPVVEVQSALATPTAALPRPTATVEPTTAPEEPTETSAPEATATEEPAAEPTATEEPAASTGGESSAAVGERVEAGSAALTVLAVTNVPDMSGFTPADGSIYLDFEVELENTGTETLSYSPVNFKAEDASGEPHSHSWEMMKPPLTSGQLAPGESITAHLTYEVPGKAGDAFVLVYRPQNATGDEGVIRIAVEVPAP